MHNEGEKKRGICFRKTNEKPPAETYETSKTEKRRKKAMVSGRSVLDQSPAGGKRIGFRKYET